jgi:hypothetical protein
MLILYSLFNIAAGGALIWYGTFPSMRYPMLLMIAAHLFVPWQVAIRVTLRDQPAGLSGLTLIDYLKGESQRQHDALSNAWLWYIFPFMPAFLWELGIWANAILAHPGSAAEADNIRRFALVVVAAIVFWGAVWLYFARSAKKLEGQIDALERLRAE